MQTVIETEEFTTTETEVKNLLGCVLAQFEDAISMVEKLPNGKALIEIDGTVDETGEKEGLYGIKVVNNRLETAYNIPIDVLVKTPLHNLIDSLCEGEFRHLDSITRIN